jgi:hypothetical protein
MEKITLTKDKAIDDIIEAEINNGDSPERKLFQILKDGFKGYDNMTLDEIKEYHDDLIGVFERDNGVEYVITDDSKMI